MSMAPVPLDPKALWTRGGQPHVDLGECHATKSRGSLFKRPVSQLVS